MAALEAGLLKSIEACGAWTLDGDEAHTLLRKTASGRQSLAFSAFALEKYGYQAKSSYMRACRSLQPNFI